MKTEMALLLMTEGRPVMLLKEVADLLGLNERTAENKIYAREFPVPTFKLGSKWAAHVRDVASYIDAQRAEALKEHSATDLLQQPRKAA